MKTQPNLALRSHINLEGELIRLFSLQASPGKTTSSSTIRRTSRFMWSFRMAQQHR